MGGPVRVNGREVVTPQSGGVSIALGDVCTVPNGGPVPFVNVAVSADGANLSRTVRVNGVPVMLARSSFAKSTGNEAGKDGGVISGVTQGAAVFSNYSYNVRFEGQPVPRALDPMLHNLDGSGIPNAASPAELQATGSADPDLDIICEAVCFCAAADEKMKCLRNVLATPVQQWIPSKDIDPHALPGHKSMVRYWDPHVPPGFYVEPTYDMRPPPPKPMLGDVNSKTMKDRNGNPLPLPGGDRPPIPGTRRPDVVVPLDPTKPPGPGNIKRIFEVKFPPDDLRKGQLEAYKKIAKPNGEVTVVGPDNPCQCGGRHKPNPQEVPVPMLQEEPNPSPKRQEEPAPIEAPSPEPFPIAPGLVGMFAVLVWLARQAATLKPAPVGVPILVLPGAPKAPNSDLPEPT